MEFTDLLDRVVSILTVCVLIFAVVTHITDSRKSSHDVYKYLGNLILAVVAYSLAAIVLSVAAKVCIHLTLRGSCL